MYESVESDKNDQEEPVKICSADKECGAIFADNGFTGNQINQTLIHANIFLKLQ
ncbi:6774_t:CDS:2 [Entrophospora sp. SA101]|nr:6774_t:CDS:2 [Entrophospora sp. SA101]